MNYSKIDAALGEALAETHAKDDPQLAVFIHANRDLNEQEASELEGLGVDHGKLKKRIITAMLSPTSVEKLSHKPWVRSIRLSQKLRPLGNV